MFINTELYLLFIRTTLAVQMGAIVAGQISAFTPDYVKAKLAAGRMFKLFDRIPSINSNSDEGLHPVGWLMFWGLFYSVTSITAPKISRNSPIAAEI